MASSRMTTFQALFVHTLVLLLSVTSTAALPRPSSTKALASACLLAANNVSDLQSSTPYSSSGVRFFPKAFTPSETQEIVKQMKTLPADFDDRVDKSVKRTNYFAQGPAVASPEYEWILERIRALYAPDDTLETFRQGIDFILMHEFDESGFFDWHVDTKPNDGTGRTDNINVMLSEESEYEGGVLSVGSSDIDAQQGDCYSYPASFSHKVGDITGGRRHTFIIAMKSDSLRDETNPNRQEYWQQAEQNHKRVCTSNAKESKLHMLHGEFLGALGRPDAEVDAKFVDMYASTPEAEDYANHFLGQGKALAEAGRGDEAQGYFSMAENIRSRIGNM